MEVSSLQLPKKRGKHCVKPAIIYDAVLKSGSMDHFFNEQSSIDFICRNQEMEGGP